MKCNFDSKNSLKWSGYSNSLYFRRAREKFYAGVWFKQYSYVPVIPDKDTKFQYWVQLSPTFGFYLDKSILFTDVKHYTMSKSEYKHNVENDWKDFEPFNSWETIQTLGNEPENEQMEYQRLMMDRYNYITMSDAQFRNYQMQKNWNMVDRYTSNGYIYMM